jgi:hypothetical protein
MRSAPPPFTDSPWFWLCLFASAGLVVLWYFSGQYQARQLRIERQGQARMRAVEIAAEGEPHTEVSTPSNLQLPLQPIFAMLAVLLAVGWAMFWRRRLRPDRSKQHFDGPVDSPIKPSLEESSP